MFLFNKQKALHDLETMADKSRSHNLSVWFGHYPLSIISGSGHFSYGRNLLKYVILAQYMSVSPAFTVRAGNARFPPLRKAGEIEGLTFRLVLYGYRRLCGRATPINFRL